MTTQPAHRPSRKTSGQADMRIIALNETLHLQTRTPTWNITVTSWIATLIGVAGIAAILLTFGTSSSLVGAQLLALVTFAVLILGGWLGITMLHPDGAPRSWRTRQVDAATLAEVTAPLGPHRGHPDGVNLNTMHLYPEMIWLVPDHQKGRLRETAERNEQAKKGDGT